ncbi:MAG: dephospho-CoA kinase [Clostridia bacterium]|nr:dephospho-CoA kinase [Clostridia bacterium]
MKILGICGSSGSGKSSVSEYFRELGFPVLDCDLIYHNLVDAPSDCLTEIGKNFGFDLIKSGKLDRKRLGEIVFTDPIKLKLLNEITHRHVIRCLEGRITRLSQEGFKACLIDAPMLFEARLDRRCDQVIAVIADRETKIRRICARDGIDRQSAEIRIDHQLPDAELIKRSDYVIENSGSLNELRKRCDELLTVLFIKKGE